MNHSIKKGSISLTCSVLHEAYLHQRCDTTLSVGYTTKPTKVLSNVSHQTSPDVGLGYLPNINPAAVRRFLSKSGETRTKVCGMSRQYLSDVDLR